MEIIISPRLLGNCLTNLLQDVKGRCVLVSCWRYGLRGGGLISKSKEFKRLLSPTFEFLKVSATIRCLFYPTFEFPKMSAVFRRS